MYEKELKFIEKTVKNAYKKCILHKKRVIKSKNHDMFKTDVVTNCDLLTEKYILSKIKKYFPKDNIVSEEFNSDNKINGRSWVIDPIDGTVCFSNNIPIWCIQVAFSVDGDCKLAVIYCPTINEIYVADENGLKINGRIFKNNINKDIKDSIVNVSDLVQRDEMAYNSQTKMIDYMGKICQKVKMFGSAGYEFCMVASGRIQAYAVYYMYIWDVMPGAFICKQAGLEIIETTINDIKVLVACKKGLVDIYKKYLKIK